MQRENPPGKVYPDGPPTAFFSTSDTYSVAKTLSDTYASLSNIYDNYYPNYATDRMPDWEILVLGKNLPDTLTLQERRDRVIAKIQSQKRTTPDDILSTVYTVINSSIPVEIVAWGCGCAGWVLDVSQLDISTILNEFNNLNLVGPDLCTKDAADFGLTPQQYADYQAEAYTYEVRIYGYTLTAQERIDLDAALNADEPARSQHIIVDGLDPADELGGST